MSRPAAEATALGSYMHLMHFDCWPISSLIGLAALTACTGRPESAEAPAPSLALPERPLADGVRELRFTASAGLGGLVPVVRVLQSADGEVTGAMVVAIARPESDTGEYAREQRARYAQEYGCRSWVADAENPQQQLCRVPFTRGAPTWSTVLASLDSLVEHQPPPEARTDTVIKSPTPGSTRPPPVNRRAGGQFVDRLPVDRIVACLDGSRWEITEWVGSQERRTASPEPLPGCPPNTEAGKAYAAAGWRLLQAVMDAARVSE